MSRVFCDKMSTFHDVLMPDFQTTLKSSRSGLKSRFFELDKALLGF